MASSTRTVRALRALPKPANTLVDDYTLLCFAEDLRERASTEGLFFPPTAWAGRLGLEVVCMLDVREMAAYESQVPKVIGYLWHPSKRERGIRIYCGLSRVALQIERLPHTWLDVWRLALELALPEAMLGSDVEYLATRQPNCSVDVIAARVRERHL